MRVVKPSPASASPHQVSTDSIVCCLLQLCCVFTPACVCVCVCVWCVWCVCVCCVLCVCGVSKWRKGGQSKGEQIEENSTQSGARCRMVLRNETSKSGHGSIQAQSNGIVLITS